MRQEKRSDQRGKRRDDVKSKHGKDPSTAFQQPRVAEESNDFSLSLHKQLRTWWSEGGLAYANLQACGGRDWRAEPLPLLEWRPARGDTRASCHMLSRRRLVRQTKECHDFLRCGSNVSELGNQLSAWVNLGYVNT